MGTRDPRITAYIANAASFARPILTHLRALVHEACPEAEETLKWGMPTFMHHGILCGFAAFKAHATFGFWKGSLILDARGRPAEAAMGNFGRLTAVSDLPARRVLLGYVRQAARLNEAGVKVKRNSRPTPKPAVRMPADLRAAMAGAAKARATWEAFSPSQRREYVEWITEAKRPDTRQKRLATTIEWLAQGKRRNWRYET
jgi:uncharacterized protein YdeI (YjbR/CyaY-like superfamily)